MVFASERTWLLQKATSCLSPVDAAITLALNAAMAAQTIRIFNQPNTPDAALFVDADVLIPNASCVQARTHKQTCIIFV
jgi:hypothetical protein